MNVARRLWLTPLVLLATSVLAQQPALTTAPRKVTLHIEPQAVGDALSEFGRQTGLTVMIQSVVARGVTSPKLDGNFTLADALDKLLSHTGLHYEYLDAKTVAVLGPRTDTKITARKTRADEAELVRSSGPESDGPAMAAAGEDDVPSGADQSSDSSTKEKGSKLEEVVVTGTHIRGQEPVGSLLTIYSRQDLDKSGAASLDQFARQMVENFSSVDTIATAHSSVGQARFSGSSLNNVFGGAAFNLHGVGASSTLTLLNGHRLAPAGFDGSFTDISQIPLGAIDHIEVLADGASAIYGADAVAGVVNIVTRKDFDGAETGIRYGAATEGGARETTVSQVLGHSWNTGNAMLNYEYDDQGGLDASQRDYIGSQGGPESLIPAKRLNSFLFSGNQQLGADTTLSGDAIYSDRHALSLGTFSIPGVATESSVLPGRVIQSGATVGVDHRLAADWHLDISGNYSRVNQTLGENDNTVFGTQQFTSESSENANSSVLGADVLANGSLVRLPGGAVKAAFGGSFRRETFETGQSSDGTFLGGLPKEQRHVTSIYGEWIIPIFGAPNGRPWARRLELSAAVRYDHYSDFGSTTNPKFGVVWAPLDGFEFRGTYGKSFRAPQLSQLYAAPQYGTELLADPTSPAGETDTLTLGGGNPSLRPETSRAFATGFTIRPPSTQSLVLEATYFHIVFESRISVPPTVGNDYFTDPALASFIQRNPPLSQVQGYFDSPGFSGDTGGPNFTPGGPGAVTAIFDNRYTNIASTVESGVDLRASYTIPTIYGQLTPSLSVTQFLKNTFQTVADEPSVSLLNTFGEPTKWKGRGALGWQKNGFLASIAINHVNAYQNTLFTPPPRIDSWTTADLYISYQTGDHAPSYIFRNVTVALSVQNLTDKEPPYANVQTQPGLNPIPFDPANASPVGRLISLQLSKRW